MDGLVIKKQECTGDYMFSLPVVCTRNFFAEFSDCYDTLIRDCLKMIPDNPDYLQVFTFRGETIFVVSPVETGEYEKNKDIDGMVVTFMLARDW